MNQDDRGRFVPGNTAALVTGAYSRQVQAGTLEAQAEALAAMAAAQQAIVSDLGGHEDLSQLQRDMVRSYLRLGLIEDFAFANLETTGPFTTKGNARAITNTLMRVIAQRANLATTLGLKRQTRKVDLAASFQEANP